MASIREKELRGNSCLADNKFFVPPKELLRPNEIPSVSVVGKTLPEAWENAVLVTLAEGCRMPTQYDADEDPESKVVSMSLMVAEPFAEPRIHKCIPDSFEGLDTYMQEVVFGIHDDRIREGGWSYSYHDRLFNYPTPEGGFDQIAKMCELLAGTPFTRRAQAITWNPAVDLGHHEPPCLQRIWCQIIKSEEGLLLEMNTDWRSRDAFKAAFMNMYALTELQRQMAKRISALRGEKIKVGRYFDKSDNFHIYGSYIRRGEMDGFIQSISKRPFEDRVIDSRTVFESSN